MPTVQLLGIEYDFHVSPIEEAVFDFTWSAVNSINIKIIPSIGHAHAQVIYRLPVRERFQYGALAPIVPRVVVMLQEMTNHKLALRLRT